MPRRPRSRFTPLLLLAGLLVTAGCGYAAEATQTNKPPAKVQDVEDSDQAKVTLTAEAAKRIGLQMGSVQRVRVSRNLVVVGRVVPVAGGRAAWLQVSVPAVTRAHLERNQAGRVLGAAGDGGPIAAPVDGRPPGAAAKAGALYYRVDGAAGRLRPGTRVRLQLVLADGGVRTAVPYSALIYWTDGNTWVYVNSKGLTFRRERVDVDYIQGGRAVLRSGPPVGTRVATVGGEELLGSEFSIEGEEG
jgi:hypothetical protein